MIKATYTHFLDLSGPKNSIGIKTCDHTIEFSGSGDFREIVENSLVTDDGRTVGERKRADLHAKLDRWLDSTWGEGE